MLKTVIWGESEYTWWFKGLGVKPEANTSIEKVKEGQSES